LLSSSPSTNEEDALINRVSSLLTDYILSRSSTTTPSNLANQFHEHETNSNLSDSAISLSTSATTSLINPLIGSNQSSHSIPINDFDKLLLRVKTAVDNRLSIETNTKANLMGPTKHIHQDLSYSPIRSTATNRRQQLLALHAVSCQETHTDDYDSEQSINRKNHLNHTTKSQSFDATNLSMYAHKTHWHFLSLCISNLVLTYVYDYRQCLSQYRKCVSISILLTNYVCSKLSGDDGDVVFFCYTCSYCMILKQLAHLVLVIGSRKTTLSLTHLIDCVYSFLSFFFFYMNFLVLSTSKSASKQLSPRSTSLD